MAWWWVNQWFSGWILCLPFNGCRERWRCDAKGLMAAALLAVSTLNYFFQSHVIIIINYPVHLLLILFISFFLQNECIISGPPELDHEEFTPEILVKWMNTWMMSEYILLFNSYGASLLAQLVKNPPAMWETWVWSLGWEDPLEEDNPIQYSCLENPHGQRSLEGYRSQKEGHDWVTKHSTAHHLIIKRWQITSS